MSYWWIALVLIIILIVLCCIYKHIYGGFDNSDTITAQDIERHFSCSHVGNHLFRSKIRNDIYFYFVEELRTNFYIDLNKIAPADNVKIIYDVNHREIIPKIEFIDSGIKATVKIEETAPVLIRIYNGFKVSSIMPFMGREHASMITFKKDGLEDKSIVVDFVKMKIYSVNNFDLVEICTFEHYDSVYNKLIEHINPVYRIGG